MKICNFDVGGSSPLVLISGPCVIESYELCFEIAEELKRVSVLLNIPYVFKASFDKANRTSVTSYRGPGVKEGAEILRKIKSELKVPVISDVHCLEDVEMAAEVLDIIQIPAFLCRQTDLLVAAAKTGKPVNVKKGQFLAPRDMKNVADKIANSGNEKIIFTERGTSFGYNNLVSDMRSIGIMQELGYPVIYDATHSVQLPGGEGSKSGGDRKYAAPLAKAAVAAGCDGLFIEAHKEPEKGMSDAATMLRLADVEPLMRQAVKIHEIVIAVD